MEYIAFKLTGTRPFADLLNNISLDINKPYGKITLSQLTPQISNAINSNLLTQISVKEYYTGIIKAKQLNIDIQDTNLFPFFPVNENIANNIDDNNLGQYQILSKTPESRFKDYPSFVVRVTLSGEDYTYLLYKPDSNAIAVVSYTDGTYYTYIGNWPDGIWTISN